VRAIRSQHPFLGITLRNINKRGKGVEQDNLPDAKKGSSHQGRQHITVHKAETAKTFSRKSFFQQARKASFREKSPTRTREGKVNFSNFETV